MNRVHVIYVAPETMLRRDNGQLTGMFVVGPPEIHMRVQLDERLAGADPLALSTAMQDLVSQFLTRIQEANGDVPTVIGIDEPDAHSLIL